MFRRSSGFAACGGGLFKKTPTHSVHYEVQKYTKDGRPRTRAFLQGPKEFERPFWEKFMHPSKLCMGLVLAYGLSPYVDIRKEVPDNEKFLKGMSIQPHGVLGDQFSMTWSNNRIAPYPDADTVVVDPTSLEYLAVNPEGAGGTSGGIYHWLNLTGKFPETLTKKLYGMCDAKSQVYQDGKDSQRKTVVHVISPDFRVGHFTEREAVLLLGKAYRNVFAEFVRTGKKKLRIPPLAAGIYSGDLTDQIYPMTQEAMIAGFEQLHPFDKKELLECDIQVCVFMEKEWDKFVRVWEYVEPASKANPKIPASVQKRAAAA